jgi:hypothetical protein
MHCVTLYRPGSSLARVFLLNDCTDLIYRTCSVPASVCCAQLYLKGYSCLAESCIQLRFTFSPYRFQLWLEAHLHHRCAFTFTSSVTDGHPAHLEIHYRPSLVYMTPLQTQTNLILPHDRIDSLQLAVAIGLFQFGPPSRERHHQSSRCLR